jgi:aminocarboxymuconate-semialdehyde decarboxylase
VDVHAHVIPENFPAYLKSPVPPDWPSMADAQPCHRHVMINGKVYRTVSDRAWDVGKRVADMAEMGLQLQAISPMPELLSYWMDAEPANELLRYINDQIAGMMAASSGKLAGLGGVPLQDIDLALAELHRLMGMGFSGVELGSNINGRPIGAPEFEPFFAECAALGACVFVHALRPAGMDRLIGPPALQQILAYPSDVGLSAASAITTNLLIRHPTLRLGFSHGGGTLGLLLPRLAEGAHVFPLLAKQLLAPPVEQARLMYFDALVFDEKALRYLTERFGDTQIMLGTDYPFNFHDRTPVDRVLAAFGDEAVQQRLLHDNAMRFLGRGDSA